MSISVSSRSALSPPLLPIPSSHMDSPVGGVSSFRLSSLEGNPNETPHGKKPLRDDDETILHQESSCDSNDDSESTLNSDAAMEEEIGLENDSSAGDGSEKLQKGSSVAIEAKRDSSETKTDRPSSSRTGNTADAVQEIRQPRRRSSLKPIKPNEDMAVSFSRRSWKNLPPPDMARVKSRAISCQSYFSQQQQQKPKRRNRVSFTSITVREYDLTLGDNPSVSYGPPVSLDWKYEENNPIDLDDYEDNRGQRRKLRQLSMNYYTRKNLLIHTYGFKEEEIKQVQKDTNKIKNQRAVTKTFLQFAKVEDLVQSAGRKAKRGFGKKKKKDKKVEKESHETEWVRPEPQREEEEEMSEDNESC